MRHPHHIKISLALALSAGAWGIYWLPQRILEDGGLYFNPYEINSIHNSLKTLLDNERLRIKLSNRAKKLSQKYTWSKSSKAIFETAIAIGTDF